MSNGKQETISDIVAEMRRDCPARHMDGTRYRDGDFVYTNGTVEKLADRIEAAAKREKEMSDTYFCGYDPEEALVAQCSTCRFFQKKHSHYTLNDSLSNSRYKHEVVELRAENARLRAKAKPVRNMDRFATQEEAGAEFLKICYMEGKTYKDVVTWLYAEANQKEGETK